MYKLTAILLLLGAGRLFAQNSNPFDDVMHKPDTSKHKNAFYAHHNTIAFEVGPGWILNVPDSDYPEINDYNKKLNSGIPFSISYINYKRSGIGFGIFYSQFKSKASLDNIVFVTSDGVPVDTGIVEERVTIPFFGLSVNYRKSPVFNTLAFGAALRMGFMPYFDEYTQVASTFHLSAPRPGFSGAAFIEYLFNSNFGVSLSVNGYVGSVKEVFVRGGNTFDLNRELSLNRIDMQLGLRTHF